MIEYQPFTKSDLDGVVSLCRAEGWSTYTADPARTLKALTAPGSTTWVAREQGTVVGFVQIQSDGFIQAHLSLIAVSAKLRGQSIGRSLIERAFTAAGGLRLDALSTEGADSFYKRLPHREKPGFRLYRGEMSLGPENRVKPHSA